MNKKYYNPKLEEFHIGFEYESNLLDEGWEQEIFEPNRVDDAILINMFFSNIKNPDCYRVKYLDKEDIEEFGFKEINEGWYHQYPNSNKDGFQILYNEKELHISFGKHEYSKTVFKGIIKNKSELKRLLTQLQIIKE